MKIMAFKLNPFMLYPRLIPYLPRRLAVCFAMRTLRARSISTSRHKDANDVKAIPHGEWSNVLSQLSNVVSVSISWLMVIKTVPNRVRVENSSLVINGQLRNFESLGPDFPALLGEEGQAFFDRTRYISVLNTLGKKPVLFLRPRRFGKSLTVNMLAHFHGVQHMDAHKSIYQVRGLSLIILTCETNCQ